jgi:hypothetical protein
MSQNVIRVPYVYRTTQAALDYGSHSIESRLHHEGSAHSQIRSNRK